MKNTLIILGGMGPQASLKLHEILLQKSQKHHNGEPDAFPAILHASMQIPDFVSSPRQKEAALKEVQATLAQLPIKEAAAIGIACNTAHMFVDDLGLPKERFVSMLDAVSNNINSSSVGLLASPHTIETHLYHKVLQQTGKTVIIPDVSDIALLNELIHAVIAGHDPVALRPKLSKIAERLQQKGATTILLGCTELPLIGVTTDLPVVDSLDALADAMLEKHLGSTV